MSAGICLSTKFELSHCTLQHFHDVATFSTWKRGVQEKIREIGEREPLRASLISRTLIFYQGAAREREALRELGLEVPTILIRRGLPGGMLGGALEWEAAGIIVGILKGAVQLLVEGNKKEMEEEIKKPFVKARVQLPGGEWIEGYHAGGRTLSEPTRSINSYLMKRYRLFACGAGQFISDQVKYEGDFFNDLFHDLTGKARYFIKNDTRYSGCFEGGKRSGPGELEKYSQEMGKFYLYYRGTWKDDQVENGVIFSPKGEKIVTVKDGVVQQRDDGAISPRDFQSGDPASRVPSLARENPLFFDPAIPPEEACPLIAGKLANPRTEFSLDESIELLTTYIHYGQEYSKKLEGKDAIIMIGNSGAGKSTLVNYLAGCTMEAKVSEGPSSTTGIEEIVAVRPKRVGGTLDEIMPINYTRELKNLMPQIETTPDQLTYCDCPGFLSNCGEEINIANAVNIRNAITRARSIKIVVPINYHKLLADRERSLVDILQICSNLFGCVENLERHHASLLLGITQVPLGVKLEEIKRWIVTDTPPIIHALSQRLFIFDPLDRPLEGGWDRATCLSQLQALPPIENPASTFKTVLTESDEKKLFAIGEQLGAEIKQALGSKKYALAASKLGHLQFLSLIEHITLKRVLDQSLTLVRGHFQRMIDTFRERCNFEHFSSAEDLLKELLAAGEVFGELFEGIDSQRLNAYYQEAKGRYQIKKEREAFQEKRLKEAQSRIEELSQLLEERKQYTLEQIQLQEERFGQMQGEMEEQLRTTQDAYLQMQKTLKKERKARIAKQEEDLSLAHSLHRDESQSEIAKERQRLESTYRRKLEQVEIEKKALLVQHKAKSEQREKAMVAERERLRDKLRAIEAEQTRKIVELQVRQFSSLAFGRAEWEKYFGEVGEEPPLHPHTESVLKGPCPFWPGKRIEETHMLVLIPQHVNGNPFHLNALSELIENPRRGHTTHYVYYDDIVRSELGEGNFDSHWVLMTRDVIPGSRNKSWREQKALIQMYAEQSKAYYELPTLLEAATAILTEHVKTGVRLYPNEPRTYTRCQEEVTKSRWPTAIGGFSSEGLLIYYDSYNDVDGVACLRRI